MRPASSEIMTGTVTTSAWVGAAPRLRDADGLGSYARMMQVVDFSYPGVLFDAAALSLPTIDVSVQCASPGGIGYLGLYLVENDGTADAGTFFGGPELLDLTVPADQWLSHTFQLVAGVDYDQAAVEACVATGNFAILAFADYGPTSDATTPMYYSQVSVDIPGDAPPVDPGPPVLVPEPEPTQAPSRRSHAHLPITRENGDLMVFVDVTLRDPNGNTLTPKVYDGPQSSAQELDWPVTFAPANIDLWLDEPGRYDLHVDGPGSYSATISGIDFLPPPLEQVLTPERGFGDEATPAVESTSSPGHWMVREGGVLRWKSPGLISPHTHDGAGANSTLLESVDAQSDRTLLGKDAASGAGGTVVGAASAASTDGTVIGPYSSAPVDGVTLGDHRGSGQPTGAVCLPFGNGGVDNGSIDSDSIVLRALSSETGADSLGTSIEIPGSLPAGVTRPVWVRGDATTFGLDARGDVVIGAAGDTVGFYGADGTTRPARPAGATGTLAALLDALTGYGLIGP